jgi:hypothetical protein
MDPVRKERRIVMISLIAVLSIVGVWWLMVVPRSGIFRSYKHEAELRKTMQDLKLPAGTKVIAIRSWHFSNIEFASGSYRTELDFGRVEAHYKQEFERHGFIYKGEGSTPGSDFSVDFCGPKYDAALIPVKDPRIYIIQMNWRDSPC